MVPPLVRLTFALAIALAFCARLSSAATGPSRPATIRVQWGGGTPHAWTGSVAVVATDAAGDAPLACEWRTLCTEPDAAAMVHEADGVQGVLGAVAVVLGLVSTCTRQASFTSVLRSRLKREMSCCTWATQVAVSVVLM